MLDSMRPLFYSKRIQTPGVLRFPAFLTRSGITSSPILCKRHQLAAHKKKKSTRFILTLDPAKLQSKHQKIYDISLAKTLYVKFRTIGGAYRAKFRFQATKDDDNVSQDIPFPARSRGVFYYHVDPHLPPISGGIRFRLCNSLETFNKGQDLHTPDRKPWNIPLLRIAHADRFKGLARFVIEEGMVEMDLIEDLRQLEPPLRLNGLHLYHLSQPLLIDFEKTALTIHLFTRKTYSSIIFFSPFYNSHKGSNPYSGAFGIAAGYGLTMDFIGLAKVRFELSTLREHTKKGPTLVLRVLEFLSPVQRVLPLDTGPYIESVTDSFAMRRTVKGNVKLWTYPMDKRRGGAKWKEFLAASGNRDFSELHSLSQ